MPRRRIVHPLFLGENRKRIPVWDVSGIVMMRRQLEEGYKGWALHAAFPKLTSGLMPRYTFVGIVTEILMRKR